MQNIKLATLIPLALTLALGPGHRAFAASPAPKTEPTAEDASWLAAASAQRIIGNGSSLNGRVAASPTPKTEPSAEDSSWLAAASAQRVILNGSSLNGHNLNGRRANGTTLGGHTVRTDGGMTVVSIELPGGSRHAK